MLTGLLITRLGVYSISTALRPANYEDWRSALTTTYLSSHFTETSALFKYFDCNSRRWSSILSLCSSGVSSRGQFDGCCSPSGIIRKFVTENELFCTMSVVNPWISGFMPVIDFVKVGNDSENSKQA